ncbi:MAG TPA: methyltransferase [Pseudomonadota bacterium]|nr:methyltransferase [Pseudomonadota bacterium]
MPTSLAQSILSPSFTPAVRDVGAVIDLLCRGRATPAAVTVALLRVGKPALLPIAQALPTAPKELRPDLVAILGRIVVETGSDPAPLLSLLADGDRKTARAAVVALGKLASKQPAVEAELVRLWPSWTSSADRRALVETLGKIGGAASLVLLDSTQAEPGSVLAMALAQAKQRLVRTGLRHEQIPATERILASVALPQKWPLSLRARAGLSQILVSELATLGLVPDSVVDQQTLGEPSRVTVGWSRPLSELWKLRTFVDVGFSLPLPVQDFDDIRFSHALASALGKPEVIQLLSALTALPIRYRLELVDQGPRRALLRDLSAQIAARVPQLINDPTDSPWQFDVVQTGAGKLCLELVPKQLVDPRFAYRQKMVAAASHPTLAAALAHVLAAAPGDVVWDPFVGSGGELCEVFLRSPGVRLLGSDVDAEALAAAQANGKAAAAPLELRRGDALSLWPQGVTCVVTNPPMGRRVCRGDLVPLLEQFVVHVARRLPRGGKLCWLNPLPNQTSHLLADHGMRRKIAQPVDMNGFWAQLELWIAR